MELNDRIDAIINSIIPLNYYLSFNTPNSEVVIKNYKLYIQSICNEYSDTFENLPDEYKNQVEEILQEEISPE